MAVAGAIWNGAPSAAPVAVAQHEAGSGGVHRLSGTDSGFLAMEASWQPMFNVTWAVLEPGRPLTVDDVREHVLGRLDEMPAFRQRIVAVPGGLHHPVAVDDPAFDLDAHLHVVDVRHGPWAGLDLDTVIARLAEEPMPTDRALWRIHLIDGLPESRQVISLHFHHAIADGTAAVALMHRLFSDEVTGPVWRGGPYAPQTPPGALRLVLGALWTHLISVFLILGALLGVWRGVGRLRAAKARAEVEVPPISEGAPLTELNDAFTPARACVTVDLPLAGLRHVRKHTETTLNDVLLAVVSAGTGDYLAARDGLPERSLLCNMPVAEAPEEPVERTSGNSFWSLTTTLATDVPDPLERLAVIARVTGECKEQLRAFGVSTVPQLLDVVPPALLARGTRRVGERLREATADVDANVLVSNVRGSDHPYELRGRTVSRIYVCGPPSNGIGCNVSALSYGDRMLVTVLAFGDALRDPGAYGAALEAGFEELAALTGWSEESASPVAG